jgi:hypothetical protein
MVTISASSRTVLITFVGYAVDDSQTTERGKPMNLPGLEVLTYPEDPSRFYRSYLVRLWRSHAQAPLRASAQCIQTGATIHFAGLEGLISFLETQSAPPDTAKETHS